MRPEESASLRLQPESAANVHILTIGVGSLVRLILLDTAWVGGRLVSRLDYTSRVRVDTFLAPPTGILAPAPVRSGVDSARRAAVSRIPRRSCAKTGTLADVRQSGGGNMGKRTRQRRLDPHGVPFVRLTLTLVRVVFLPPGWSETHPWRPKPSALAPR
jgi:hypothetical protein